MTATLLPLTIALSLLSQSPPAAAPEDGSHEDRLRYLKDKASRLTLIDESTKRPLTLTEEPVLRFSNPERDRGTWDGATFLWLDGKRPVSAVSFGLRRPNNEVFFEFTSLTKAPLVCERGQTKLWSPPTGALLAQPIADAPPPADNAAGRLLQMRTIARRFSATCIYKEDSSSQLRLLPQPLYRFDDKKQEVLDGAVFAMVVSNDPEVLLLIEASGAAVSVQPPWRYSVGRMSSQQQIVRFDDKEIVSFPPFYKMPSAERKTGPYTETFQGRYQPSVTPRPM